MALLSRSLFVTFSSSSVFVLLELVFTSGEDLGSEVGNVTKIYIHPLKCGTPLVVSEVECNFRGQDLGL